jgi:hypothetical protein
VTRVCANGTILIACRLGGLAERREPGRWDKREIDLVVPRLEDGLTVDALDGGRSGALDDGLRDALDAGRGVMVGVVFARLISCRRYPAAWLGRHSHRECG